MSALAYEFLENSFLLNSAYLNEKFKSVTEEELIRELSAYRQLWMRNSRAAENEIRSSSSNLKLFSGTDFPKLDLVRQCALYLDQFVIAEPIFPLTEEKTAADSAINGLLGECDSNIDRDLLTDRLRYLQQLKPFVLGGYVKLFPTSFFLERPNPIPYRYSLSGFLDDIPGELQSFFAENAVIDTIKDFGGKFAIVPGLELGRGISVRFKNHGFEDAMFYRLVEEKVLSVDRKARTVESSLSVPNEEPQPELFERWVFQSINQTSGHLLNRILFENELANDFRASYLCQTLFVFELLRQVVPVEDGIQTNTVNTLLNFHLPFIENLDALALMKIRNEDGEAFANFRRELDARLRELRTLHDPNDLKTKTENVFHEISEVQVHSVEQKIKQIRRGIKIEALVGLGGLISSIETGGFGFITAALAAAKGYKSYLDYISAKEQNPAFFLWKVLKRSR